MKRTVVFDFDGVIHSYTSGWKGQCVIPDPPVPGIKEAIADIRSAGYEVVVVSTRCVSVQGQGSVRAWLLDNGIEVDAVMMEKPPAIVYIDDRAICFDGKPEDLLAKIRDFAPWYIGRIKPRMTNADRIRVMSNDELAEFIMLSPEMEFDVCECCEVFRGHGAYTPCGTEDGWCTAELRCGAFKKWLQQPAVEAPDNGSH